MNLAFLVGNIIMLIAVLLLTRSVIRDRKILMGFDFTGSLFTLIGLIFFMEGYYEIGEYGSVIVAVPTIAFWLAVVLSLSFYKNSEREMSKEGTL